MPPDPSAFADGVYGPFIPYGGGERACAGRQLAQAEIRNVVPAVLGASRLRPLTASRSASSSVRPS